MPARRSINIGIQRRVETASRYLPAFASKVADFDFDVWRQMGTGNAAENEAAENLRRDLLAAHKTDDEEGISLRLS